MKQDEKVPINVRTASIVQQVANSICDYIQVEIECPSMNDNKRLPILDLEMANVKVVMADSAMPYKTKKACLMQEVVRILRNDSIRLDSSVKKYHLS